MTIQEANAIVNLIGNIVAILLMICGGTIGVLLFVKVARMKD